jgi:hypothetical protein
VRWRLFEIFSAFLSKKSLITGREKGIILPRSADGAAVRKRWRDEKTGRECTILFAIVSLKVRAFVTLVVEAIKVTVF